MRGKGTADAILAVLAPKKSKHDDEMDEEDSEGGDATEAKAAAGEALADAIKSGDGAAIAAAFEDMMACCSE